MPLNAELVGKEYPEVTYEVTAEAIERFAAATNDHNERYRGPDAVASPVFPVIPAFPTFMSTATDEELGADLLRLVHGSEEHILHRAIKAGDRLTIRAVLESVEQKDSGETFTVNARQKNGAGELVAEVKGTMFIRGTGSRRGAVEQASGSPPEGEPVYEETTKVEEDQTRRYAEASGDYNPIHLDENVARAAGLPGIINHGMCTMALAVKGAVDGLAGGRPDRIKRTACRFSRPVLLGQELTTRFWASGGGSGVEVYHFETYNPEGKAVIKNGVVEITP